MKNYEVSIKLYNNREHTESSSGCDINTFIQAINQQQVQLMIEAQYNGCAVVRWIREAR